MAEAGVLPTWLIGLSAAQHPRRVLRSVLPQGMTLMGVSAR
jgi:hypothetical protein